MQSKTHRSILPRLSTTLIAFLLVVVPLATPVSAGTTESEEYIANGLITVFCEGHDHDEPLHEPWCLPLTTLNGGEEFVLGGAEWDVADHLGKLAVYSASDAIGTPYTILGIGDHITVEDFVDGCGALSYLIPPDADGDDIDGGIHLVAQISIVHVDDDLNACLGSTGTATLMIAA